MKDSVLKQNVIDEIEFEPSIDANDIGVAVEDGIITLSGHVPSYSQKIAVERAVARVAGVRGIAQNIEVRFPGGPGTADDEIARRAVNTIKWNAVLPDEAVQVKVQNGWVTLTGKLDWNYQKQRAADAVRDIKGVVGITNQIELRPVVSKIDVKKHIENALKRSAEIEAAGVSVNVVGNKVTLEGKVKTWADRFAAENAAWATPGVSAVEDKLAVS